MPKNSPTSDRRAQIIDGALSVFASQGFSETSIKDIAEAAGLKSAGLIYHYFASKEELLLAVVQQRAPALGMLAEQNAIGLDSAPVRQALEEFAMAYLRTLSSDPISSCVRVMLSEALRNPTFAEILGNVGPLRIWGALAKYLARQMELGTIKRCDPQLAARSLVSPLFTHVFVRSIVRMADPYEIDDSSYARFCVQTFLEGCGTAAGGYGEVDNG